MENGNARRPKSIGRHLLLTAIVLVLCPCALALNPSLDVSQYAHNAWRVREGFSKGQITSIAQTPDGYLWLGTEYGLLRFDGVRSVSWPPSAYQPLPSNNIFSLLASHDGTLWIGTDKGLASWNGFALTQYSEVAGQNVFALVEDRDRTVWVGTNSLPNGKLCAIRSGVVQCYGEDGRFGKWVKNLYEDKSGNLWVTWQNGLWRWKPGPPEIVTLARQVGRNNVAEDSEGRLLIGTSNGIKRLVDGKLELYSPSNPIKQFSVTNVLRDRDGSLWMGSSARGLVHVHEGRTDLFTTSDGLSANDVLGLFEDQEGNIWVATTGGLDCFRELAVSKFAVNQGRFDNFAYSVLVEPDGNVLATTAAGLNRWNNGQFTITLKSGTQPSQTKPPYSLFQDSRGRIWAVTLDEFGYLENDRFVAIRGIPGGIVRSIAEDSDGSLWIANQSFGLIHLKGTKVLEQIPWDKFGHKDFASALAVDPLERGVWLGFFNGGVAYFKDEPRATYGPADGLGDGLVNDFQFDNGAVWMATAGGLSRLKNNRIATLTSQNGLPCDGVHWVREDDDHFLWLATVCGLVRIARANLDTWAAAVDQNKDAKVIIQTTVLDVTDGVTSQSYPIGVCPQVAKGADGKLWFPGLGGVSVLDPRHIPFNRLLPPVHVEQITADRKSYDLASNRNGQLQLPPLLHDLQIDYTALSFVAPEKVRFRYKLEGFDRDWQDAGTRRQAFYTNLPPRNYRFRVMACNNNGVWNETGTFLDFSIAPAYYQTTWFRLLVISIFVLMLLVVYQLRLQQVARQVRSRMEERLEERERIARDLHDTLLQSVQGLILKFHAVAKQIPGDDASAHDALEKALDRADEVLAEGRDRVQNLRTNTIPFGGLPAAFEAIAKEVPQGRETTFKTVVEGRVRMLHPVVREETYCIGREAIVNALTHSKGLNVEVEITYDPRQFRLRVRDDGSGLDPKILDEGGRPNHWGLQGMRERSERIGAQLKIWSRPDTGTEVELIVPGATAYQDHTKTKKTLFRRSAGIKGEQL